MKTYRIDWDYPGDVGAQRRSLVYANNQEEAVAYVHETQTVDGDIIIREVVQLDA
jgi:hypothetical protein